MQTVTELLELIRRGAEKPATVALEVIRTREPESHFVAVTQPTFFLSLDATGLTVHHSASGVHALRGEADVGRGSGATRWVFEGREVPVLVDVADLQILGTAGFFLDPAAVIENMNLDDADLGLILAGEVAGRTTWVVPSAAHSRLHLEDHPRLIEVDQEHGTLLAVESEREHIEAVSVLFPSVMSDPTWEGATVDWKEEWDAQLAALKEHVELPASEDLPGFLEQLPPQSTDPRRLRIWIGDGSLEGSYPRYKIGESVRLPLTFRRDEPPLPGLETTRRGWIRHLDESHPDPLWPVIFTGDGWSTYSYISKPLVREAELDGWFGYSAWDPESVFNDVKVEGIYGSVGGFTDSRRLWQKLEDTTEAYSEGEISLRDVVLDVTLDGATPPPLMPELFRSGTIHAVGEHLWVKAHYLPVLRCWHTGTGRYLGQTFVPVSLRDSFSLSFFDRIVHDEARAWPLTPGAAVTTEIPYWTPAVEPAVSEPVVPEPWEIITRFSEGLYALHALTQEGSRTALARTNRDGELEICPIHTDGFTIGEATRIGERYYLNCWELHVIVGPDFRLESVEHTGMDEAPWSWTADKGVAVNSAGPELVFVDQDSGEEITRWPKAENSGAAVQIISPTRFVVAIQPFNAEPWNPPETTGVAVFDAGSWSAVELESAPPEI